MTKEGGGGAGGVQKQYREIAFLLEATNELLATFKEFVSFLSIIIYVVVLLKMFLVVFFFFLLKYSHHTPFS